MDDQQEQTKRQEERSILINFVLDKSGSMEVIREATIAGFNQFLRDQQQEGGVGGHDPHAVRHGLQHGGARDPACRGPATRSRGRTSPAG